MKKTRARFTNHFLFVSIFTAILLGTSCAENIEKESKSLINQPLLGKIVPKNSSEITSSPFGIQAGTLVDSLVARAAEIGVKWTRLGASWSSVENEKGVYTWDETDKAFEVALKNGITPFVTIGGGNTLYSKLSTYDDPKLAEIYGYRPEPPIKDASAMKAFLKFTRATVERYKDKIDYWEVWNEPNHRNYWGATPDGKEYGKLLVETARLIRQIDPGCKIIGGSMAGINPEFAEDFLSVGSDTLIDIISYHNYGAVPEERVYKAIELWKVIDRYNPEIELWQGECGYPSHSSSRDYRGRAPWGLKIQAKWLLRQSFVDTYYCKATLSNYFKLVHNRGRGDKQIRTNLRPIDQIFGFPERGGSRVRTKGVNEKCLLTNPDFDRKPAFYAYQNLCAVWSPNYKPNPVEYKVEVIDQGIFYGIGEEDDAFPSVPLVVTFSDEEGNNLLAWWLPWNMQEYLPKLAKVKISLEGMAFTDPVMLDPLSGEVFDITIENQGEGSLFEEAMLADYPMIIVERETIKII
jgi:hypothetical protein